MQPLSGETLIFDLQKAGEIDPLRCTRGLKTMAKGSLGQKVLIGVLKTSETQSQRVRGGLRRAIK